MTTLRLPRLRGLLRRIIKGRPPDAVKFQGSVLPLPKNRFCRTEWKDNAFYVSSAEAEVERLRRICGLNPSSHVLDIGCGQGRLAIGLQRVLPHIARYVGVDVHAPSISWCRKHLKRRNFEFIHLDGPRNARYYPNGRPLDQLDMTRLFPFDANSFDIAFLYSVFTHMLADEVKVYLTAIHQVLNHNGYVVFTMFIEEGVQDCVENPSGYLEEEVGPLTGPLNRVRYSKPFAFRLFDEAGFDIEEFLYRSETVTQQSVVVLKRRENSL